MQIGLITYPIKHKKTQQVVNGLIKRNYKNLTLLISSFKKYKKKKYFFNHRPDQFVGLSPYQLKNKYNLKLKLFSEKNIKNLDFILLCGSGLIKNEKILKHKIINCHSGLIPSSRGLDSFKWSLMNLEKVGTTLHYINKQIDLGPVISHNVTKIYNDDTLFRFARRHYNCEIDMLVNFDKYIDNPKILKISKNKPRKRMSKELEIKLINIFEKYKKKYIKNKISYFKHETSFIDENCKIGNNSKIWHWSHISKNSKLGINNNIGQNVFIGENVQIGDNVKIQNNVSVFDGVKIEDDVFCGPSVVFTNVKYPVSNRNIMKRDYEKTLVKKGATLGANSTIICGNNIGINAVVGAGSVVTKKVKNFSVVVGNPAIEIGRVCLCKKKIYKKPYKIKLICKKCNTKIS